MNEKLIFATGNQRKIKEAQAVLASMGIDFDTVELELDEIQHSDPTEITRRKVMDAYEILHRPVVVNDTSWSIPALKGFPGGYMKEVNHWFTTDDWLRLLDGKDRTVIANERIAYSDGETLKIIATEHRGTFLERPEGDWHEDLEKIVSLYGGESIAINHTKETDGKVYHGEQWREFGEWYKNFKEGK